MYLHLLEIYSSFMPEHFQFVVSVFKTENVEDSNSLLQVINTKFYTADHPHTETRMKAQQPETTVVFSCLIFTLLGLQLTEH